MTSFPKKKALLCTHDYKNQILNYYSAQIPPDFNKSEHPAGRNFSITAPAEQIVVRASLCSPSAPEWAVVSQHCACCVTWEQLLRAIPAAIPELCFTLPGNSLTSTCSQVTAVPRTAICLLTGNKRRDGRDCRLRTALRASPRLYSEEPTSFISYGNGAPKCSKKEPTQHKANTSKITSQEFYSRLLHSSEKGMKSSSKTLRGYSQEPPPNSGTGTQLVSHLRVITNTCLISPTVAAV